MCWFVIREIIRMKENYDKLIWLSKSILITFLYMRYLAFELEYVATKTIIHIIKFVLKL